MNIKKIKNAYYAYCIKNDNKLDKNLFNYIKNRILANKDTIEELIRKTEVNIKFDEIFEIINDLESKKIFKKNTVNQLFENRFIYSTYIDSKGIVAVECYKSLEVIRYLLLAVKTRTAIVVSDVEYYEYDVKHIILMIIKEALKKFNINDEIVSILPFEEVDYDLFDEIIYTYDKDGNKMNNNLVKFKAESEKMYIYLEDETFSEEVNKELFNMKKKGVDIEIISGNFNDVIDKLNLLFYKGVSIYTKNPKMAYIFINVIKAKNVFVNASFQNIRNEKNEKDELYFYKNIIFPISEIK